MLATGNRIDQLALRVENLNLQIPENVPCALIVGDRRHIGTAGAVEGVGPFWPSGKCLQPLSAFWHRKEAGLLLHDLRSEGAQRRDVVNNPDATTMRRQYEIIGARLDYEIVDCHCGEVAAFVLRPAFPTVVADEESKLGSNEEQVRADQIFLNDRSEERRVGKECRSRCMTEKCKKNR